MSVGVCKSTGRLAPLNTFSTAFRMSWQLLKISQSERKSLYRDPAQRLGILIIEAGLFARYKNGIVVPQHDKSILPRRFING